MNLSDPTQALGLPEGSVRAVIALSLVVLFAILAIFLYGGLSNGELITLNRLSDAEKTKIVTNPAVYQVISVDLVAPTATPSPAPPRPNAPPAPPNTPPAAPTWSVTYRALPNQTSAHFAKQLLILVGTLVTSVTGFYFGTQSVQKSSANKAGADAPPSNAVSVKSIEPPVLRRETGAVPVTIRGANLANTKSVTIVTKAGSMDMKIVETAADHVTGLFPIDNDTLPGTWDVVVTDANGKSVALKGALQIT